MRKRYETEDDLANEGAVRTVLEKVYTCKMFKVSPKYRVNYFCSRNNNAYGDPVIGCWVEIVCRNIKMYDFTKYMINLEKIRYGRELSDATGVPFILAVRFTDRLANIRLDSQKFSFTLDGVEVVMKGRTKSKRDACDVEPCVLIPISMFSEISIPKKETP